MEKKDKVAFIVPVSKYRFPYFLEFHKQMQSCAAFGSQVDVFVAFSRGGDLEAQAVRYGDRYGPAAADWMYGDAADSHQRK